MKKKIALLLSIVMCMFVLISCGSTESYDELTRNAQLESACQNMTEVLADISADEATQYASYYESADDGEVYATLLSQWASIADEAGDFVEYTDFEVTKAGKTLTATQTSKFSGRNVTVTYVLNSNTEEVTAINVALVYTLGEKMGKAGLNTIMGILIVFVVLVLISLVIYCFKFIPSIRERFQKKEPEKEKPQSVSIDTPTPNEDDVDDLELVAVISAAVAAASGASTDDFVVRSIKRRF